MKAAFYECDITPPLGGFMWGHYKEVRAQEVHQRLYAKAVVINDDETVAAIVVVDTCVIPPEMHDIVTKRIYEYTGITADKICIASNHSHTGAPVSDGGEIACYADATYKDVFFRLVADAVILAYHRLDETEITYSETVIDGITYCRNHELKDGTYITHNATSPDIVRHLATPDRSLPILMFKQNGKPVGAIINFACHQDTMGGTVSVPGYCGDYSSILSNELKKHYGSSFVSLFLLGACGDINTSNPDPNAEAWRYTHIGEHLAKTVIDTVKNSSLVDGKLKVIKQVTKINRRMYPDKATSNAIMAKSLLTRKDPGRARNMMYYVSTNQKEYSELYVQGISIGDVLISLLPGEIYTNTGREIKSSSPFKKTIVVENCNSYCGYIPTKECFNEKSDIYEISLCYHSCHVPEAVDIITEAALDIANKLAK